MVSTSMAAGTIQSLAMRPAEDQRSPQELLGLVQPGEDSNLQPFDPKSNVLSSN